MPTLTKKQKEILDYIKNYIKKHGFSPTFEEIGKYIGKSFSTTHEHVNALIKKGLLTKNDYLSRGLEVKENEEMVLIPLLGAIAAGLPIEAVENKETIAVPKNKLSPNGNFYALRVNGDSMIEEGVNNNDIILVKQQQTAENGQKVVALINNNEATLKKFYQQKGYIRLQPANQNYSPIIINKDDDFAIQGVLFDIIKNQKEELKIIKTKKSLEKNKKADISKFINTILNDDIMALLKQLPDNSVDMIFGDPDYNVGIKYNNKSYTRNFNEYIDWYIELAKESMRVLKPNGNLFMMNYPKQNAHLRVRYLDERYPEIFEYVWVYNTNVGHTPKRFTTAHRSILHVKKVRNNKFYKDAVALPYKNPTDRRILKNLANGSKGRMPYSWFYYDLVKNVSKEKTYHACQIPQKLTEMFIKASTKENDIVLILFGGSGAELELCKKLKRNYISAEIDKKYHAMILDRLKNGYIKKEYKLQNKKNGK